MAWIILCLAGAAAWARDGRFNLNTFLETSWRSDSNFYKLEDQERTVNTFAVSPGLIFGYSTAKSLIDLNYRMNAFFYDDRDPMARSDEDAAFKINRSAEDENYQEHILNLTAATQITPRLMLRLTEGFMKTRDPAQSDQFDNSTDRDKYIVNRLTPEAYYTFGDKFAAGVKYRYTIYDYIDAGREDSREHRGIGSFYYMPTPHLDLYLEYQQWRHVYKEDSSDYDSSRYSMNFRSRHRFWEFTGGLGYHERKFDLAGLETLSTTTWRLGVGWGEEQSPGYLRINLMQDFNDLGYRNSYYTSLRVQCDAGYRFIDKIDLAARCIYQLSDYENNARDREDDLWRVVLSAEYRFRDYLTAGMKYGIEYRDSNLDGFDYDNRFVMAQIRLAHDWGGR